MLYGDYIGNLIGFEDIIIKDVKNVFGQTHIYLQMEKRIHECPRCGHTTSKVHDYRHQVIKDIPSFGQDTYLHLRKRRHVCPECGKRFYEDVDFLPRYHRMTNRLYAHIISAFRDTLAIKHIAQKENVSITTAMRIFDKVDHAKPRLPEAISIDEFRDNTDGEKFQCILTDPRYKKVLDILPDRKSETLYGYFSSFNNRSEVKYVIIDMSNSFREVAHRCFPKAKVIADRYHVVRQVVWAFENVRKEEQKKFADSRRKYFKRSRQVLLKHADKLQDDEITQVEIMLKTSDRLRHAYHILQDFYRIMDSANSQIARKRFSWWVMKVESFDLPEFYPCLRAFRRWSKEILASMDIDLSNGYTEGVNNKIKVLKRVSYGVRNFKRFRNRILCCMQ